MAGKFGDFTKTFVKGLGSNFLCALQSGGLLEKVGTARITNKKKVSAEHGDRLIRTPAMVGNKVNHVLGSVPRRVNGLQFNVANFEAVTISEEVKVRKSCGPFALPIRAALR